MSGRRFGKAIGARSARKLIREIGGAPDPDLIAERERVLDHALGNDEIVRLNDGRVLWISYGSANVYSSADAYRDLLALVDERRQQHPRHPLGSRFPQGTGFIDAVPTLIRDLPGKLRIPPDALDGSVDSLEQLDRAARHIGGDTCLDDPTILGPLVAYVGEVMRNAKGGEWAIELRGEDQWEAVIVGTNGHRYPPFAVFKELLERGSMYAVVSYETGSATAPEPKRRSGMYASRELPIAPAIGALGTAPEDSYVVTTRYGDGRPWGASFTRDVEIEGFPFAGGTDAWFKRNGEIIRGVLSRACAFGQLELPAQTSVCFYKGHRDGRVSDARLGANQEVHGIPCKAGTAVFFNFYKHQPYLSAATLGADHEIGGVLYRAGTWFSLDRKGRLTGSV